VIGILTLIVLALYAWRLLDHRADFNAMRELLASQPANPQTFTADMVMHLPEPAQRYVLYTIKPGTPLWTVARIRMAGQFGMGNKDKPDYLDFTATQILAAPLGFVWKMRARRGVMAMSGSDTQRWTRFWIWGLLPVARMGGNADHTLSAFGRYVAEAVIWTPAALLPGPHISWEGLAPDRVRAIIKYQGMSQAVDLTVKEDGQPAAFIFQRWSNANPEKQHRLQPFGGHVSGLRDFGGFCLPTHVEAGNHFGTDQYFPFFVADIADIEFQRA
tara:strand:- start:224 stop:1042 length:819 start_codon:yes stop_codon:yes gene_type:complete